jgi:hypothetical protein
MKVSESIDNPLVKWSMQMYENRTASEKKNKCWNKKNRAVFDAIDAWYEEKEAKEAKEEKEAKEAKEAKEKKIKPIITRK